MGTILPLETFGLCVSHNVIGSREDPADGLEEGLILPRELTEGLPNGKISRNTATRWRPQGRPCRQNIVAPPDPRRTPE